MLPSIKPRDKMQKESFHCENFDTVVKISGVEVYSPLLHDGFLEFWHILILL